MKKGQKKAVKQVDGKVDWWNVYEKAIMTILTVIELARFILDYIK